MKFEEVVDALEQNGYISRRSWLNNSFLFVTKQNIIEKDQIPDFKSMSPEMTQYLKNTGKHIIFEPTLFQFIELQNTVHLFPYDGERDGDDWYIVG